MIWLMAGLLSLSVQAQEHSEAYTNRLINSQDPYLLLHAHNPVDWYPWGPEALDRARRENKPIFISVGYSTCYWCHVAEREIYSNPEIAKLMNQWFVNIKIDREERPDLDRIYMRATQILTGRGGWPNNVFLTPELKPFYAGSYFPPADQDGRSGFPRILNRLHEAWVQDNERLLKTAESVFQKLQPASRNVAMQNIDFTSMENWMERAVRQSVSSFDSLQGGFGQGPTKFPKSPRLSMLLVTNNEQQSSNASEIVRITLEAMAAGGIMDQLAGGFHRYSTEPGWSIPHFEKMLYDNAQLLGIYARAYEVNQSPVLRLAALRTAHYLSTEMRAPKGGFYSAQDAEVNGVEGESYAWTKDEIKSVLGEDDGGAFFELYSLVPMPKAHFGHQQPEGGVLRLKSDTELSNDEQIAAAIRMQKSSRNKLLAVRQQRAQPARDEKIVIADNALAIMGFSRAGQSLNEPALTKTAVRTANWLWKNAFDQNSGELKHQLFKNQVGGAGFLDDYALLGLAFINLYEDTGKKRWRLRAEKIANEMLSRFARPDGDLAASWDNIDLVVAPPEQGDSIKPSGKSSAIALLMELSVITGEKHYAISAYKALLPLYSRINANPAAWGTLLSHLNDTNLKAIQDIANEPELATTRERPLNSSAYVHARGFWTNSPDAPSLTLTINIDKGYHINANPASDPFLIATELYIEGQADLGVDYPVSQSFRPEFAPQGIEVYQGRIILKARPAKIDTGGYPELSLRVQACNDEVCLSPATILVPASGAASK